jgi:hypothetical protein
VESWKSSVPWIGHRLKQRLARGTEMKFEGKKFFKASIDLDNNQFYDCIFDSCTLVYRGGPSPKIAKCSFRNSSFSFSESAANTLFLIATMYHRGFRDTIEKVFDNIALDKDPGTEKILFN